LFGPLQDPFALDGFFGRYGIGIKTAFVFGEVTITVRSKACRRAVAFGELPWDMGDDYEMRCGPEDLEAKLTDDHWTEITISKIPRKKGLELLDSKSAGGYEFKEEIVDQMAQKYCLYISGLDEVRPWMKASARWKNANETNNPGKIKVALCGKYLDEAVKECRAWKFFEAFGKQPEKLIMIQELDRSSHSDVFAYVETPEDPAYPSGANASYSRFEFSPILKSCDQISDGKTPTESMF
jgi:hypothetical protein